MEHPNLVLVGSFGSRAEAELAKGALQSSGIDAMIDSDTIGTMRDHVAWSGRGFRILVREEDAKAAQKVLSPSAGEQSTDGDDCPNSDPSSPSGPSSPSRSIS